ncbi:MAG: metallophosphatase family protein [Prevotellaceae bacterium]|jgi:putative phosphoesterase|nr:metallophosphatase family protein [Prevotellaceae bacterium]
MRIGILSDTHGLFDEPLRRFLAEVDEVWHAGDIGGSRVADAIAAFKPLRAVYGNIDGEDVRRYYPLYQRFTCEGVETLMTHIGGYPGRYDASIAKLLRSNPPQLFICGHSHILKVMFDKKLNLLHINPGAAGKYGLHTVRTAVRLEVKNGSMSGLEVGEWKKSDLSSRGI